VDRQATRWPGARPNNAVDPADGGSKVRGIAVMLAGAFQTE
jgi:hypothetical protein